MMTIIIAIIINTWITKIEMRPIIIMSVANIQARPAVMEPSL